ncbi:MAG: M48 family metalloprotease [Phycisphaerae bacterium]|nr:M48 family metalloprotease [Phycisphaerae bacterium]
MKKYRHLILSSLVLLAIVAPGCSRNPVTGEREFVFISPAQEIAIGNEAAPQFEDEFGGKVPNEALQAYVRSVGERVAAVSDRQMPYEYALLASNVPNAFALPGGKIYVTAGLMSRMAGERELAAVLGHETGHVAARHNVKQLQQSVGWSVLIRVAGYAAGEDKREAAETIAKVVAGMTQLKYSRGDEYEADETGIKYMAEAGYNPWGMVELLTSLKNLSDSEPGTFGEMFQTHPLTSKRIDKAREIIEDEDKYEDFSPTSPDPRAGRFLEMRALLKSVVGDQK